MNAPHNPLKVVPYEERPSTSLITLIEIWSEYAPDFFVKRKV